MSLPALRYEQARHLVVGRVRVRSQVVSDEDLSHGQEAGAVRWRELLKERPVPGCELEALKTARNLGTAIDQHRAPIRAPLCDDVRLREPRHRPRLSTRDRINGVFPLWSPRQYEFPVRGEPPVTGTFWSYRPGSDPADLLPTDLLY
jgi:hypothetical protein